MFTGIVREVGRIASLARRGAVMRLAIEAPHVAAALEEGASVCVSGVCLTTVAAQARTFTAEVVRETLSRTTLGERRAGDRVNLELALASGEPLGGHLVAGHVDAVGEVKKIERGPGGATLNFSFPLALTPFMVEKGSVALDGVSLTIVSSAALRANGEATVALVPHTLEHTTLGSVRRGSRLNVEADLIARYVAGFMAAGAAGGHGAAGGTGQERGASRPRGEGITWSWLARHGYLAEPEPGRE